MPEEEPTWRPVGDVTMLTSVTVESVEFARECLETIVDAGPYRLDDATVARMLRMWHDTSELNEVFAAQGRRWRQDALGTRHEGDVIHFCALVDEERALIDKILSIATGNGDGGCTTTTSRLRSKPHSIGRQSTSETSHRTRRRWTD